MSLQLKSHFSGGGSHPSAQMSGIPKWYSEDENTFKNLLANKNNWWYHPTADFLYSLNNNQGFMAYGLNRSDFASIRVMSQEISWLNERENEDGSITAEVTIKLGFFGGNPTDYARNGYNVINGIKFNNEKIAERSGLTTDGFFLKPSKSEFKITTTVQPENFSNDMKLEYYSIYPNGEISNANMDIGFSLYNPNPPFFIPMAIRNQNKWKSLNKNNGSIKVVRNGKWEDVSKEKINNVGKENIGQNRIVKNGKWVCQGIIGD